MIDDDTIGDATRNPGGETPEPVGRTGARATVKKATRKVAKKTAKKAAKKVAKKTAKKTAKKAAKKVAKKTAKKTAGASGRSGDGRARKKKAEKAAKSAAAASTVSETVAPRAAAAGPAASGTAAPETAPPETSASGAAAASDTAPSGAATPETAADGSPRSAKHVPSADAARRIGPAYPGALVTATESEDPGGLGSLLALWGPLIIVGFLVLVFLGGEDRGETTAGGHDGASAPASVTPSTTAGTEVPQISGSMPEPAGDVLARASGGAGASPRPAASRIAAAWTDSGGAWPAPPGPYRNPESYGLPAGERWVAHASEWAPSADSRGVPGYGDGGNPPPQWVRCEAPYYWCPAPGNPAW